MEAQESRQALRSQRTRELLMDATLSVIADVGYARATSAQISEAAGVSRGAQTHHFKSKAELVLAALDRMAWRYEKAARDLLKLLPPGQRTLRTVVMAVWDAFLDDRFIHGTLEVLVAARTDDELREAALVADSVVFAAVASLATEITHPTASEDELAEALTMSMHYFRGVALERGIRSDIDLQRRTAERWCDVIEQAIDSRNPPAA